MKVLSLLLRNQVANEFTTVGAIASMKVLSLLLRNMPDMVVTLPVSNASMKVLSLLLRNDTDGQFVDRAHISLNESPELIAQESTLVSCDVARPDSLNESPELIAQE